ncbi:hypothetical protein DL764_001553 [Monosporascus ibericus]|uniref:CTP synthase n=1 Tax=Monosporascus ibericus TaxID=155417 RepID=A0A4Q4TP26_9PEZI|nr:hypothetical protein DL764_001553 [Monosporascus ibericus]
MRYVLVSGGVISGVGKGIIASSLGLLLKTLGLRVTCIKIDPYVSVDAGLMNPAEHGETYVLGSGNEVDLDLGNYERYLSIRLTGDNNITTGKIYTHVLQKERRGGYLGKTVQIVPHVVDTIKDWIKRVAKTSVDPDSDEEPDICIIELGVFVSYVPIIHNEFKTKPTQHAVKTVRSHGLIPDLIACRAEEPLPNSAISKIALHCQVEEDQVMVVRDMPTVYQVPLLLSDQGLVPLLQTKLNLDAVTVPPSLMARGKELFETWKAVTTQVFDETVQIALVGKYVKSHDAYISVVKSLEHSSMRLRRKLVLHWVDSEHLEPNTKVEEPEKYEEAWEAVKAASGIIVPGGFGVRGVEGMMLASKWARENSTPFLGVCLGFQVAVIQYSRDICGIAGATSEEFENAAKDKVIIHMPDLDRQNMGGTMRLGLHKTIFGEDTKWSKLRALYGGGEVIEERHRHRYEVNPEYVERLVKAGMNFTGKDTKGERMGVFELKDHPYYIGIQFHAEYQSRVLDPSKPYLGFVAASIGCLDEVLKEHQAGTSTLVSGVKGGHMF